MKLLFPALLPSAHRAVEARRLLLGEFIAGNPNSAGADCFRAELKFLAALVALPGEEVQVPDGAPEATP